MDIAQRFIDAAFDGRDAEAVALMETWPVTLWYSIAPHQLGRLLARLDPRARRRSPTVALIAEALSPKGSRPRALQTKGPVPDDFYLWATIAEALQLRLSGDPVAAYELLSELYAQLLGPKRYGIGVSDPILSFVLRHAAESALLAGRLHEALVLFERLASTPNDGELVIFAREAHLRAALIHQLYGSTRAAGAHLRQAENVPRTTGWAEAQLDLDRQLIDALRQVETPDAAVSAILDLSYASVGELWPFIAIGLHACAAIAGRRDDARSRIDELWTAGYGRSGTGFVGTTLPALLAYDAILSGDVPHAQAEIAALPADTWLVVLVRALIDVGSGAPMRALAALDDAEAMTSGLRQANRHRILVTSLAHYLTDDPGKAALTFRRLPAKARRCGAYEISILTILAPGVLSVVADHVPDLLPDGFATGDAGVLEKPRLTRPELEVLTGLARGLSRSDIAKDLFRSVNTVKTHQRSLYRKLGVSSAAEAVDHAIETGHLWNRSARRAPLS
ncbi:helix-turn-helix transcriptional regulator [Microbacterium sp. 22303]|uniref:helix-turn-helix transcriptional regulator n=1 Tax=Microbacterium sp. 22303 TaxID=3453905 RepID=UPI003F82704B